MSLVGGEMDSDKVSKRPFTLLEISLSIALLALVASVIAMPLRSMVRSHTLNKSLGTLAGELRKAQVVAIHKECDLKMTLSSSPEGLAYVFSCDDPPFPFAPNKGIFKGLRIQQQQLKLTVFSTGRIFPIKRISLYGEKESGPIAYLDLTQPLVVSLEKRNTIR